MKIAVTLAALPVTVFGAAYIATPPAAPPVIVKRVPTETIQGPPPVDLPSFRLRWEPVADMPPATVIAYVAQAATEVEIAAPVRVGQKTTKPAALRLSVCARHGMRKVTFTRRGHTSWRCRR